MSIAEWLDQDGKQFDRGFWRHPQSGAPIVKLPEGGTFWGGAPSGRYKSHLENTYNLQRWAERQTLVGTFLLVADGAIEGLPSDLESSEAKKVLDGLVGEAKDAAGANLAAARGTYGHLLTELDDEGAHWLERMTEGEDLGLGPELQEAIVVAWQGLLEEFGLEVLAVEQTVVSFETQTAGTLDRIARTTKDLWFQTAIGRNVLVPAGTVLVLDIKTGGLKVAGRNRQPSYWDGYALQLYAYATGQPIAIDPDDPDRTEWLEVDYDVSLDHALIAHLDIARALETGKLEARMVYVDLSIGADQEAAVRTVREIRKAEAFGKVNTEPDVSVRVASPVPYHDVVDWLRRRMETIRGHDGAKADLLKHWPKGVVPPGKGIAPSDIDTLVELLDRIEAKHQISFGDTDPRAPRSGHSSQMSDREPVANPGDDNPAEGGNNHGNA